MKRDGKLAGLVRRAVTDPRRADISLYATSGAYYLFLSLGPLVALLLAALPYTALTRQQLLDVFLAYAPDAFGQLVYAIVADVYAGSLAALGLSIVAELWSAAKFLSSVVRGVGAIVDGGTGGFFRRRLMGAVYTVALIVFILMNLTLLLFGERLFAVMQNRYPAMEGLWAGLLRLRGVVFFAGLTVVNALLFRYAPKKELRFFRQIPGAAFSAAAWLLFSRAYSWALERFGLFGVYGSIAAVITSLFWIYCSLYILFLGAWLNTLWGGSSVKYQA